MINLAATHRGARRRFLGSARPPTDQRATTIPGQRSARTNRTNLLQQSCRCAAAIHAFKRGATRRRGRMVSDMSARLPRSALSDGNELAMRFLNQQRSYES
jgi:hypothetical protein